MNTTPPGLDGIGPRAISLSEAARRFAELGRGPSRATLSRDATAGKLSQCKDTGTSQRPRYDFAALRAHYGVDTEALARGRAAPETSVCPPDLVLGAIEEQLDRIAGDLAKLQPAQNTAPRAPLDSDEGLGKVHARLDRMGTEIEQLRLVVNDVARNTRDILEMRRMLMLKYDAEAGLLRQRAETAEQRLRQAPALDSLSREVSSVRQAVARLAATIEDRLPYEP